MDMSNLTKKESTIMCLKEIQNICRKTLSLIPRDREMIILKGLLAFAEVLPKKNVHQELIDGIKEILILYPNGAEHSLMELLQKKAPNYNDIPFGDFEQTIYCYKISALTISLIFKDMEKVLVDKNDLLFLKELKRRICNIFVNDPNINPSKEYGDPYYKRNYAMMENSRIISMNLLDQDFERWMSYFEDVLGEDTNSLSG